MNMTCVFTRFSNDNHHPARLQQFQEFIFRGEGW